MEIDIAEKSWQSIYKVMIGSILPRPIGWISTIDSEGRHNLAPFSFFNAICANPPHVMLGTNIRGSDRSEKDTLRNLRSTREFVVNIVTEDLAIAMNLTSTELPPQVDEFQHAGLSKAPAHIVNPPRVAESPIHFECIVTHIIDISDQPGGGSAVIGRVVHLHVEDGIIVGEDKIDLFRLKPIGRLAGSAYCRVTDIFEMTRPASQIKRKQ